LGHWVICLENIICMLYTMTGVTLCDKK
jgi:hypothetical protein